MLTSLLLPFQISLLINYQKYTFIISSDAEKIKNYLCNSNIYNHAKMKIYLKRKNNTV